jgi:hypothetical protein
MVNRLDFKVGGDPVTLHSKLLTVFAYRMIRKNHENANVGNSTSAL